MADSLDDFFAKKDKKRGKDKPKAAALSAGALVKELEEGSKQVDYPVRKDIKTSNVVELLGLDANDTDWRDFEDVEKRDYTGLKVKEMSLQDQADEEQRRNSEHIEPLPESTPWKMKEDQQSSATNNDASNNSDAKQQKNDNVPNNNTKASEKISDTSNTAPVSFSSTLSSATSSSTTITTSATENTSTTADNQAVADEQSTSDGDKESASESKEAAKDDTKGDKPSAKAAYVPPHARMQSEFKLLEPSKLGKSKPGGGRSGPIPNLQDEQSFPSLG